MTSEKAGTESGQRHPCGGGIPKPQGLYSPEFERDGCGIGLVANVHGRRSHAVVERGIEVLKNLLHRGAAGADERTGDGAGILIQIPDSFFRRREADLGFSLPPEGSYGVGTVFMPAERGARAVCRELMQEASRAEGVRVLGWRDVPVRESALGEEAKRTAPAIEQWFFTAEGLESRAFERRLALLRRQARRRAAEAGYLTEDFYIAGLSSRTLVYKGLMNALQLPRFYEDLQAPDMASAMALVHQRYSTNTFPCWRLAQPFRFLAHNGEINTLRGNINAMHSRERHLVSELFGADIKKMLPIIEPGGSDSACLDNALELLTLAGREIYHAMAMLIPQAWGQKYPIGPDLRGFYEYHAGLMEPWDGPAAVVFSDGRIVGAILDRNGLRPMRWTIMKDGFVVMASEAGVLDLPPSETAEKGSLRPGEMMLVNLEEGRIMRDKEIKMSLARRRPYRRWVEENKISIHGFFSAINRVNVDSTSLLKRERLFGYSREDINILASMAATGHEPVGSMGADQPPAMFSDRPHLLYWHFKQLFAQVTNPAIDPIREELVMSLMTFLGTTPSILEESPGAARLIKLAHPILLTEDMERLRSLKLDDFKTLSLPMGFAVAEGEQALKEALEQLCKTAAAAAADGSARLFFLSDKALPPEQAPIPALLAVSAVNTRLVAEGLRTPVSLLVETGEAREVTHIAALLAFGASAVNPYLAFEVVADMAERGLLDSKAGVITAVENYVSALCKGLLKIMSKLGISTLRSYRGAQMFEIFGLSRDVAEKYFAGAPWRMGCAGLREIAEGAAARHAAAAADETFLESGGMYSFRRDGERHRWNPTTIVLLQRAVREKSPALFAEFCRAADGTTENPTVLRDLLVFRPRLPVPLEEVEPAEQILKRFVTGAMSFGSISREAHETIAAAMNRLGCMSNSGEGGEDRRRYAPRPDGENLCSAIKQVASGRFGVTAEYLVNARELQIKIAQGAKPGEGGQLPGHKVNAEIAMVRHSTPGVTLISPPPHHDIYSIEDIAQLIYDLKCVNPEARVSVKLVSAPGVGTVAAGVAKAGADLILISGYDGGTGASPLSSIKHAGLPWELGLAETQQTLLLNRLRSKVRLQVDGQLRTARDIIIAAMLGAEEFGFATAVLICLGCVMMRQCHNNTCPAGIATQLPELRKRFAGKPEHVENYFRFLAEEVRMQMSRLGFRRFEEMVGRCELLNVAECPEAKPFSKLNLSALLHKPKAMDAPGNGKNNRKSAGADLADEKIIRLFEAGSCKNGKVEAEFKIRNTDRSVGARLSGFLARRYGDKGLPDHAITLRFKGCAGQSFGAFGMRGVTMLLEGEANDYLGKGLSGAVIAVKPPRECAFDASANIIAGNVALYGATAGELYVNGRAGERFAVRNSGAFAVVEGVGDHGCEYMTGGRVAILGPTGVNFAAGMSGGIAYVLDETGSFDSRCNLDTVDLEGVETEEEEAELKRLVETHFSMTGSRIAAKLLAEWRSYLPLFVKVFPTEYRLVLGRMTAEDQATKRATKGLE